MGNHDAVLLFHLGLNVVSLIFLRFSWRCWTLESRLLNLRGAFGSHSNWFQWDTATRNNQYYAVFYCTVRALNQKFDCIVKIITVLYCRVLYGTVLYCLVQRHSCIEMPSALVYCIRYQWLQTILCNIDRSHSDQCVLYIILPYCTIC